MLFGTVATSFALGYQKGKTGREESAIVFSCPNTVLERQKISETVNEDEKEFINNSNNEEEVANANPSSSQTEKQGTYVGSKNGTKYYTPGCPGVSRIKPENYIWFNSAEDATLQGYSKGSC